MTYKPLPKIPSKIAGLDDILQGGFPIGRTTLINGGSGCGKSIIGMEFLYRNALENKPGIFISFEEKADYIRQNFLTLGWDLAQLEQDGKLFILEASLPIETVISGEFDLNSLFAIIAGKVKAMNAELIVIDALDILLNIFTSSDRKYNETNIIYKWLQEQNLTAILTTKLMKSGNIIPFEFLDFMVDCVIHLDQRVNTQITTRRIRIIKYRGSGFGGNEYPYIIDREGINVVPISNISLIHRPLGKKISTGMKRLDTILDGGYRQGSCTILVGASGTGKTTFVSLFTQSACQRGERVLSIQFEESAESVVENMRSPGINLQSSIDADKLRFITILPEAMGSEEHLNYAIKQINEFKPQHVIIDAISAMERVSSEQQGGDYAKQILNFCKQQGISIFFIRQSEGFVNEVKESITGFKFSSMADNVILLRYLESGGEVNRLLVVMKTRGSKHSNQYREYTINDTGIDILDVYMGEKGVLTGIARQVQIAKEKYEYSANQQLIKKKHNELALKKISLKNQAVIMENEIKAEEVVLEALIFESDLFQKSRNVRAIMRGQDIGSEILVQDIKE